MGVWVAIRTRTTVTIAMTITITITIMAATVWVSKSTGATALRHLSNGRCAVQRRHRYCGVGSVYYQQRSGRQNKPDCMVVKYAHQSISLVFGLISEDRAIAA